MINELESRVSFLEELVADQAEQIEINANAIDDLEGQVSATGPNVARLRTTFTSIAKAGSPYDDYSNYTYMDGWTSSPNVWEFKAEAGKYHAGSEDTGVMELKKDGYVHYKIFVYCVPHQGTIGTDYKASAGMAYFTDPLGAAVKVQGTDEECWANAVQLQYPEKRYAGMVDWVVQADAGDSFTMFFGSDPKNEANLEYSYTVMELVYYPEWYFIPPALKAKVKKQSRFPIVRLSKETMQ
jgi:hypothetical protein